MQNKEEHPLFQINYPTLKFERNDGSNSSTSSIIKTHFYFRIDSANRFQNSHYFRAFIFHIFISYPPRIRYFQNWKILCAISPSVFVPFLRVISLCHFPANIYHYHPSEFSALSNLLDFYIFWVRMWPWILIFMGLFLSVFEREVDSYNYSNRYTSTRKRIVLSFGNSIAFSCKHYNVILSSVNLYPTFFLLE